MTFASVWGPKIEELGAVTVAVPPVRSVRDNPDTPITNGGQPFWERVWYNATFGVTRDAVSTAAVKTSDGAKAIVTGTKDALAGPFKAAATETKGILTRLIVIGVLVLVGFLIVNQVVARRVA